MSNAKLAGRLLGFLRPYWRRVILALLLGCATVVANAGLLAIAAYLLAAAALKPLLITLSLPIYLVQALGISRAFVRYGERLAGHRVTFGLLAELRVWLFSRLEPLAPRLMGRGSGDLLARLISDLDDLQHIYLRVWAPMVVAAIMGALTVAIFAGFSVPLALAAGGFLALSGVAIPLLVRAVTARLGARQVEMRAVRHGGVVDGIQGMPDLLALGQGATYRARMAALEARSGELEQRQARALGLQAGLGDLTVSLAVWTVLLLAVPLVGQGRIGGVYLGMLALLMLGAFEAVQPLGAAFAVLGRATAAGARLFTVAEEVPTVAEPSAPQPIPSCPVLVFEDVSFAYPVEWERRVHARPPEAPALRDISFTLPPGKRLAVVGASGAGKSTLAYLAVRFWDPTSGLVRLGGTDIRRVALADLRACIALASQDTSIYTDTLRSNLRMAHPEASDREMRAALEQAQLGEFLERLPGGLDTWLGEQGTRLSGGERQRLAIARVLLRRAPILILDEPTANLDPLTEATLLEQLHRQSEGRALLLITHRLVGMERMDEIIVLDQGRVVQRGTHAALRAIPGRYRELLEAQESVLEGMSHG